MLQNRFICFQLCLHVAILLCLFILFSVFPVYLYSLMFNALNFYQQVLTVSFSDLNSSSCNISVFLLLFTHYHYNCLHSVGFIACFDSALHCPLCLSQALLQIGMYPKTYIFLHSAQKFYPSLFVSSNFIQEGCNLAIYFYF